MAQLGAGDRRAPVRP